MHTVLCTSPNCWASVSEDNLSMSDCLATYVVMEANLFYPNDVCINKNSVLLTLVPLVLHYWNCFGVFQMCKARKGLSLSLMTWWHCSDLQCEYVQNKFWFYFYSACSVIHDWANIFLYKFQLISIQQWLFPMKKGHSKMLSFQGGISLLTNDRTGSGLSQYITQLVIGVTYVRFGSLWVNATRTHK